MKHCREISRIHMNSREVPRRANIRGKGCILPAVQNDRMLVEGARRATRAPLRRLSQITMEITTSLGSHTVAITSFVGHFVFTRAFDTAPPSMLPYSLLFPIYLLLSFPFRESIRSKVERARADTWESERSWAFVRFRSLSEPRGHCVAAFAVSTFLTIKLSLPHPIISALLRKHSADRDTNATQDKTYDLNWILNVILLL